MTGNNMKSRLLIVSFLTVLAVGLAGCNTKQFVQEGLNEQYPNELAFLPTGSEQSFVISFTGRWQLSAPEWIRCSQSSGPEGTVFFRLATDVNRTMQDRNGIVYFSCQDGTVISIYAYQPAPYLRVSFSKESDIPAEYPLSESTILFNWNDSNVQAGGAASIYVESNVDWKFDFSDLTTPDNEFILSQDAGYGSTQLTLVPRRNNLDKQAYECLLTAQAYMPDGETPIGECVSSPSFSLHQNNLRFLINDRTDDVEVIVDELRQPVRNETLIVDSELPWNLSGSPDWVEVSPTSGDAGVTEVSFRARSINPTREERLKDIILTSRGGADRLIQVRQYPFVFSLDAQALTFENEGIGSRTLNIRSSGPWSVEAPDWLSLSASGQEGNGSVTLSCKEQNLDLKDLTGFVHFASQYNELVEDASVTQEAFAFDATPDETLQKIPALSTADYPIQIHCSGAWSLSADQSWVRLSAGEGNKDATVSAGSNTNNPDLDTDRDATVTLVSETHKAKGITLTREIPLRQTRFLFSVTPSSTTLPAYAASSPFVLDIECSEKWEIVACPAWLTPETASGTFDKKLSFTLAPNTDKTDTRSGKIRVHSLYNDAYLETAPITQDAFVFGISQSSFTSIPPVEAGQKSLTVTCTKDAPWEVVSKPEWLTVNTTTGAGTATLVVSPQDNRKTASRVAELTLKSNVSDERLNVRFSQDAYVFSVPAGSFSFGELDASSKTLSIDCSSNWTINPGSATWLKFSTTTGKGNANVTLTADKNVDTKSRTATVTVYSNLQHGTSDELKKDITVTQSAYRFNSDAVSFSNLNAVNDNGADGLRGVVRADGHLRQRGFGGAGGQQDQKEGEETLHGNINQWNIQK